MKTLAETVKEKQQMNGQPPLIDSVKYKLRLGTELLMAYVKKEYTAVPVKSMIALIAGLLYFAMPLDVIPDFILPIGFLDDATVLLFVARTFNKDLKKFEAWKQEQSERIEDEEK
ncbi:DUF1232 domain-containing protein [Bacillaceae bacterium SIJ1]|uniref:YkvA family protein n=1 Tax=Litoribacterium kuwaitense TaxID=1398745 RepID=UPI0013EAD29E|nr:YkvA family protein [Litoribacterium kuwaitense]NGP44435.1 DUF1232 domain-containing protein [Litoribacterium kuwaitense]